MAKHRGEPEYEIFQPGDRVQIKPTRGFEPTYVFVVLKGGYTIEGDWDICVSPRPMTSKDFVKIGQL